MLTCVHGFPYRFMVLFCQYVLMHNYITSFSCFYICTYTESQWMYIHSGNKNGISSLFLTEILTVLVLLLTLSGTRNLSTRKSVWIERQTYWKCSRDLTHCRSGLFRGGRNRCTKLPKWFMRPLPYNNESSMGRASTVYSLPPTLVLIPGIPSWVC